MKWKGMSHKLQANILPRNFFPSTATTKKQLHNAVLSICDGFYLKFSSFVLLLVSRSISCVSSWCTYLAVWLLIELFSSIMRFSLKRPKCTLIWFQSGNFTQATCSLGGGNLSVWRCNLVHISHTYKKCMLRCNNNTNHCWKGMDVVGVFFSGVEKRFSTPC